MKTVIHGGQTGSALRATNKISPKTISIRANTFNSNAAPVYRLDVSELVAERSEEVSTSPNDVVSDIAAITSSSSSSSSSSSLPYMSTMTASAAAVTPVVTSVCSNASSDGGINVIPEVNISGDHPNVRIFQATDSSRPSLFLCPVCRRSFSSEKYLSMHLSLHKPSHLQAAYSSTGDSTVLDQIHGGSMRNEEGRTSATKAIWTCKFCTKVFTQNSSYRNHMRTHSDERPYPCTICSIGFKEKYHLKKHVLYKHSTDLKERCRICGKPFKDSTAVRAHERIHSEVRPYRCNICGKSFKTSECLWHHENRSKTCGKAIAAIQSDVINSSDVTGGVTKPRARRARRSTKTESEMSEISTTTERCPVDILNESPAAFQKMEVEVEMKFNKLLQQQRQQLQLSQMIAEKQSQPQPIGISQAPETGMSAQPPYRYINIVTTKPSLDIKSEAPPSYAGFEVNKIEPMMCPKEWFKDVTSYASYTDTHAPLSSDSDTSSTLDAFSEVADSDIPSPAESTSSEKSSPNLSKLLCAICGKKFLSKQTLRKHVSTMHSQDRPYRCHLCDNGFKLKVHLKKHHLYRHSNEYPCECTICGKRFKDTSAVRLHERIHSLIRPFECPCGKSFKTKENLWGHRNRGPCEAAEDFVSSNMRLFRSTEFGPILGVPISSAAVLQHLNGLLELQRLETTVASVSPDGLNSQSSAATATCQLNGAINVGVDKRNIRGNSIASTITTSTSSSSGAGVPTAVVLPLYRAAGISSDKKVNSSNQAENTPNGNTVNIADCIASQSLNSDQSGSSSLNSAALSNLISSISASNPRLIELMQQTLTSDNLSTTGNQTNSSLLVNHIINSTFSNKLADSRGSTLGSISAQPLPVMNPGRRQNELRNFSADDDEPKIKRKVMAKGQASPKKIAIRSHSEVTGTMGQIITSTGVFQPAASTAGTAGMTTITLQQLQQLQQLLQLQNSLKGTGCVNNSNTSNNNSNSSNSCESYTTQTVRTSDTEEPIYLDDINLGASEDLSSDSVQLMSWSDPVLTTGDLLLDSFSAPASPCLSDYDLAGVKILDHSDSMNDMHLFGSDDLYSNWSSDEDCIFNNLSPTFSNLSPLGLFL